MRVDYAILGAGALGSLLAGHLARAGADVVLIARGARARRLDGVGLRIEGLANFEIRVPVCTDPGQMRSAATLIVATKALDTAATIAPLRGIAVDAALSLQNGVLKNALLQAAFGAQRVVGAVANLSGERLADGTVRFTSNHGLLLGEEAGPRGKHTARIASELDASGIRCSAVERIRDREWSKFVVWAGLAGLAVTTRQETCRFLANTAAATTLVRVMRELAALAASEGAALMDDGPIPAATIAAQPEPEGIRTVIAAGQRMQAAGAAHRVSMLQDLDRGRPLEVDETLGHALRLGAMRGVPLPELDAIYARIAATMAPT